MTRHTPAQIDEAVEKSLRRLKTDYIDLYQLHWPDRAIPPFGYQSYRDYDEDDMVPLEDILGALHRHVEKGNIRHIGVSNEFPWAVMKFLNLAEKTGGPRLVSNQCAYSLVARRFDYGSRQALFPQFLGRYASQDAQTAIIECNKTARALGLTPTQFALKFVESRPFVTSNIIGATTMAQLKENIDAHDIDWTSEMEKEAHRLHKTYRSPVAPEKLHITVGFFGDVDDDHAEILDMELARYKCAGFDLSLSGVGHFGEKTPHAIWAGLAPSPPLLDLHKHCRRAARAAKINMETRVFRPHIPPFLVDRFYLLSSHRKKTGPNAYREEACYPLLGP